MREKGWVVGKTTHETFSQSTWPQKRYEHAVSDGCLHRGITVSITETPTSDVSSIETHVLRNFASASCTLLNIKPRPTQAPSARARLGLVEFFCALTPSAMLRVRGGPSQWSHERSPERIRGSKLKPRKPRTAYTLLPCLRYSARTDEAVHKGGSVQLGFPSPDGFGGG